MWLSRQMQRRVDQSRRKGQALRWLHHSLIHFLQNGYGWPAETSRAQAGGVAMPLLLSFALVLCSRHLPLGSPGFEHDHLVADHDVQTE